MLPSILMTRRAFVIAGGAAVWLKAEGHKGAPFPAAWKKYPDPTTELDVFRLTDPAYSSTLPASYNRIISHNSGWMLFCGDRGEGPQAYRIDLNNGDGRQLTQAEALDRARRFLRLGFVVYQIRDAKGLVFMDEAQITQLFVTPS